jgi:ABC-type transporter Mla MlaB component
MAFVTEFQTEGARLVLSGDVTVADATALHAALAELSGAPGTITVDDTRVSGFDISLLQLILAFGRTRRAAGGALVVTGGPAVQRLAAMGLEM